MADATVIPTWLAIAVALGTPLLTFGGVVLANRVSRKGDVETEARSRREETMRNLRWASELAISLDEGKAALGLAQLRALDESAPDDAEVQAAITAALESVLAEPEARIEEAQAGGDDVHVVLSAPEGIPEAAASERVGGAAPEVAWEPDEQEDSSGQDE
jgi:hypothetical protein